MPLPPRSPRCCSHTRTAPRCCPAAQPCRAAAPLPSLGNHADAYAPSLPKATLPSRTPKTQRLGGPPGVSPWLHCKAHSKAAPPRPLDTPGRRPFSRFAPWAPYARTTAKDGPTPRPTGPRRSPHQLISKPPQSPRSASAPRSASPRRVHPPCDSTSRLCRDGRFRAFTRDASSRCHAVPHLAAWTGLHRR